MASPIDGFENYDLFIFFYSKINNEPSSVQLPTPTRRNKSQTLIGMFSVEIMCYIWTCNNTEFVSNVMFRWTSEEAFSWPHSEFSRVR